MQTPLKNNTSDSFILETIQSWLTTSHKTKVTLITLVYVSGSGPRKEGAMLAISNAGQVAGSVSGGCIEEDLLHRYSESPATGIEKHIYGIDQQQAAKFQLPCGASVEVVAEPFNDLELINTMLERLDSRESFFRVLNLKTVQSELSDKLNHFEFIDSQNDHLKLSINDIVNQSLLMDEDYCIREFGPSWHAFIVGVNDITSYLVPLLTSIGFSITICEPRKVYRDSWPQEYTGINIESIITEQPEDWLSDYPLGKRDVALFVSHDAKIEDLAILDALNSKAFYVGALGSRKTTGKRYQRLVNYFDADPLLLENLDAPIGFDLRSKTTAEIAIAIAAKLVAVKNNMASSEIMTDGKAKLSDNKLAISVDKSKTYKHDLKIQSVKSN